MKFPKLLCLSLLIVLTSTSNAQVGAVWTSPTTGTLSGVNFTMTNITTGAPSSWDLSNAPFSADPLTNSQQCTDYQGISTWTATFATPVNGLRLYMKWWRAFTYTFDQPFTLLSGSNITVVGNSVVNSGWANGIIEFTNPVTTVSVVSTTEGCCSWQLLTFGLAQILPVELISFDATLVNKNEVALTWETATEINNDYFTIQRSVDAVNWENIATVDGAGNSSQILTYRIKDDEPHSDRSYYRLKQTDFDGSMTYSQLETIILTEGISFTNIYPVPAKEWLTTIINSSYKGEGSIEIFDRAGRVLKKQAIHLNKGENKIKINVREFSRGTYIIRAATKDYTYVCRSVFGKE